MTSVSLARTRSTTWRKSSTSRDPLPVCGIAHVDVGHRGAGLRGRNDGVGYLLRRYRKIGVPGPGIPCACYCAGDDDVLVHMNTS